MRTNEGKKDVDKDRESVKTERKSKIKVGLKLASSRQENVGFI